MIGFPTVCTLSVDGVEVLSYKADADRVAYVATIPSEILLGLADALGLPEALPNEGMVSTYFTNEARHESYKLGPAVYVSQCNFMLKRGGRSAEVTFQSVQDLSGEAAR